MQKRRKEKIEKISAISASRKIIMN